MSTHYPAPHPAPARFDVPETLQVLGSEMEVEGSGAARVRGTPAFAEHFPAIVRGAGCGSDQLDYSDARYFLDRAVPPSTAADDDLLNARVDTVQGVGGCLTATNLAEIPENSHRLGVGTVVHAFGMSTRGGGKVYLFNHPVVWSAVVRITGLASGGGKYTGYVVDGVSTATASGNLALPEGMVAGMSALILNEEEDGQAGHRLAVPGYAVGQIAGVVGGQAIVVIRGALGATSGPTLIAGSGVAADSGSWSRGASGTPVNVVVQTRTVWDSSAGVLYAYERTMSFDARGVLVGVSGETAVTVDTATACT